MADVGNAPSLHDELTRKTFETLDWLCTSVKSGHLTKAQFNTGIAALFTACAGLVDGEFSELITEAAKLGAGADGLDRLHFLKGNQVISLTRQAGHPEFWVTVRVSGVPAQAPVVKHFQTPQMAVEAMERFVATLAARGFSQL